MNKSNERKSFMDIMYEIPGLWENIRNNHMDDIFRYYKGFGISHDSNDAGNSIIEELSETYIEAGHLYSGTTVDGMDEYEYSSGETESFKWKSD